MRSLFRSICLLQELPIVLAAGGRHHIRMGYMKGEIRRWSKRGCRLAEHGKLPGRATLIQARLNTTDAVSAAVLQHR